MDFGENSPYYRPTLKGLNLGKTAHLSGKGSLLNSTPIGVGGGDHMIYFPPDWHPGQITCWYLIPIGIGCYKISPSNADVSVSTHIPKFLHFVFFMEKWRYKRRTQGHEATSFGQLLHPSLSILHTFILHPLSFFNLPSSQSVPQCSFLECQMHP